MIMSSPIYVEKHFIDGKDVGKLVFNLPEDDAIEITNALEEGDYPFVVDCIIEYDSGTYLRLPRYNGTISNTIELLDNQHRIEVKTSQKMYPEE